MLRKSHTIFRGSENQNTDLQQCRSVPTTPGFSPRTHRARIIAAKRMAASDSTALAEILGIPSSSSSSSVYPSAVASPVPVVPGPASATAAEAQDDSPQRLTTSSQSVADYFKAKLGAKAHGERQARPTLAPVDATSAPPALAQNDDNGRAGLGLGRGPPRIPDSLDEEPMRGGIGASSSSSKFMVMFMPAQPAEDTNATAGVEPVVTHDAADHDDNARRSEKRRAKEERRREKEERRRKRAEAGQVDRATVDVTVDGAPATGKIKKLREPGAPDGWSDDGSPSGVDGKEAIGTKKRKKRDKDKNSGKHRRHEE